MDTIIRVIKLPPSIKGVTIPDEEGNYNIYINKNMSRKVQIDTYLHELEHIKNNDFSSNEPIPTIEERTKQSNLRINQNSC